MIPYNQSYNYDSSDFPSTLLFGTQGGGPGGGSGGGKKTTKKTGKKKPAPKK